jgi:hypothetical protein
MLALRSSSGAQHLISSHAPAYLWFVRTKERSYRFALNIETSRRKTQETKSVLKSGAPETATSLAGQLLTDDSSRKLALTRVKSASALSRLSELCSILPLASASTSEIASANELRWPDSASQDTMTVGSYSCCLSIACSFVASSQRCDDEFAPSMWYLARVSSSCVPTRYSRTQNDSAEAGAQVNRAKIISQGTT